MSGSIDEVKQFIDWSKLPFVVTKAAVDILPEHLSRVGTIGIRGNEYANDFVRTSGRVYAVGCSLSTQTCGYNDSIIDKDKVVEINENIAETLRYFRVHSIPV